MHILSTFKLGDEEISKIEQLGAKVTIFNSENELIQSTEVEDADAIIANHRTLQIDFLDRCKKLKWIHAPHIGIERLPMKYLKDRKILVTNARGTAGVPISENILCMMLMLARKSKDVVKNQIDHLWKSPKGVFNLFGKTLGVLGTGNVGSETANRAKAFGMNIIGLNTTGKSVENFEKVYKTEDINEFLVQCDFIVCTLPPTEKTIKLIDEEQFKCMKPTVYIINISRAAIFNEEILYDYLKNEKIAGAALDVFMDEFKMGYLPAESPFWELDNLIVTPHMAGGGHLWNYFSSKIIMHNIESFCKGHANEMLNIRDYDKGY